MHPARVLFTDQHPLMRHMDIEFLIAEDQCLKVRVVTPDFFRAEPHGTAAHSGFSSLILDTVMGSCVLGELEKLPRIAKPGMGALVESKWPRDRSSSMFSVPTPPGQQGLMRVKLSVASYCAFPDVPNPILWTKIGGRVMERREITGPTDLEFIVQIEDTIVGKKGLSIGFTPRVEMPYAVDGFENEDRSKPKDPCLNIRNISLAWLPPKIFSIRFHIYVVRTFHPAQSPYQL